MKTYAKNYKFIKRVDGKIFSISVGESCCLFSLENYYAKP